MDVSAFRTRTARLRRFLFRQTSAAMVILDVSASASLPNDPVSRLAELLQILLTVDAARFADPDDPCDNLSPSIFAFPTADAKQDIATILAASNGSEPIIVDFRLNELVWPVIAPHLACDVVRSTKVWDRTLRNRRRLCAIVTRDIRADDIAIRCDGGLVLQHSGGEKFDLGDPFWRAIYADVVKQRCMLRETWRRSAHTTAGDA